MNLAQRIILCLGCVGITLVWLMSASDEIQPHGTRFESNWNW